MRQPDLSVTQELVEKAQGGDAESFGLLIQRYRGRLEALVHLRMGARLRAKVEMEDVLQEACLGAFRSMSQFHWTDEGSFYRWIGRIVENTIRGFVRHHFQTKKRDPSRECSLDGPGRGSSGEEQRLRLQLQDTGTPPDVRVRRQERLDRLEAAVAQLEPDHREVILLSTIQGLPMNEVGERMGRSRRAASMLFLRALGELRRTFGTTGSFRLPGDSRDLEPRGAGSVGHGGDHEAQAAARRAHGQGGMQ